MYELDSLGFGPYFAGQLHDDAAIPARIAGEHKDSYLVWSGSGERFARLAGRLIPTLADEAYPTAGDWVTLKEMPSPGDTGIIDRVLARRTVLTRGAAGRATRGQVIAANIDTVFVVCGLDANFSVRRIQRYVARVRAGGASAMAILNKADACDDVAGCVSLVERAVPGVPVIATSAMHGYGLERIAALLLPGVTATFVGSSGAGKSTLINAFLGEERLRTGEIRAQDGRGRHTTASRRMVILPSGGLLIDTPGMRELALPDEEGIGSVFPDIEQLASRCRFRNCTHHAEPGCAVRQSVESGELPAEMLEHYLQLTAEARASELRHDQRLQRQSERLTGRQRAKDLQVIRRLRGEK